MENLLELLEYIVERKKTLTEEKDKTNLDTYKSYLEGQLDTLDEILEHIEKVVNK